MGDTELEFLGFRTSVVVDRTAVPQHDAQFDEAASQATSWIASEPDKCFSIVLELVTLKPGAHYGVEVYLDGHRACGRIFTRPDRTRRITLDATYISPTQKRRFMFGRIELSDDDALLDSASSVQAVGEIKLVISEVGGVAPNSRPDRVARVPEVQKMHERAKKGLVHSVRYGDAEIDPTPLPCYNPSHQRVLATHIIRYRPLAWLQATGIIAYTPVNHQQNTTSKLQPPAVVPALPGNLKKRKASIEANVKLAAFLPDNKDDDDLEKREDELWEQLLQVREERSKRQRTSQQTTRVKTEEPVLSTEVIDVTNLRPDASIAGPSRRA